MKIRNKITACAVAVIMAVCALLPVAANAAGAAPALPLEDYIVQQLENFAPEIDIQNYSKPNGWGKADIERLTELFIDTVSDHPELFYVGNSCTLNYSYKKKGNVYTEYTFKYTNLKYSIKKEEYAAKKAEFDKAVKNALSVVQKNMTDTEKALALHDYLALNNSYDYSLKKYSAYDALVGKSSVCEGYSMAYLYLLRKVGIDSVMVRSEKMNHAWNYVKINGKWYHADVTWDDPGINNKYDKYDMLGYVSHKNFLLSDAAIKKAGQGHKDWVVEKGEPAATDKTYDKYFWQDIETGMFKIGKYWYYAELDETSPAHNNNWKKLQKEIGKSNEKRDYFNQNFYKMYTLIKRADITAKEIKPETVLKIDSTWFTNNSENSTSKSWEDASHVKPAAYNGKLYYNTAKEIYVYDPVSKKSSPLKGIVPPKGTYFFGITMSGPNLTYTAKTVNASKDNFKTIKIEDSVTTPARSE